jgi:hypothetical protein
MATLSSPNLPYCQTRHHKGFDEIADNLSIGAVSGATDAGPSTEGNRDRTYRLRIIVDQPDHRTLPAGREAIRWFLLFFHLLPVPLFMMVVAGRARSSFGQRWNS